MGNSTQRFLHHTMGDYRLMPGPPYWSPDKITELRKMILSGANNAEICEHFDRSYAAIKQIRHRYNLPPVRRTRKWSGNRLKQFSALRRIGWTRKQLAEFYGISLSAVGRVIDEHAVPRRHYDRLTRKQIQSIRNLSELGFGNHYIGRELYLSGEQIRKALAYYSKKGWPM